MQPFQTLTATAAKLDQVNVDTDQIIPKQFLKKIERTGFGIHLFHDWRFLDDAGQKLNPDFILNQSRYQGAQILVAGDNFGCGSSREHAPWALLDYGFRSIIAPSFADIFYSNCAKNGILLVSMTEASVQQLFTEIEENIGCELTVDLPNQKVQSSKGLEFSFEIDPFIKNRLLNGLDDIGWTLQYQSEIESFEANYQQQAPWMFIH
ncbi:MAG: 3-isopropylmalate dehydratase small subunit [Deltaproteobacteria bacterium]|jgi:3-isopropylmalate/(R)-2-methylmalate dehydratase small subunit|nr:3-isopropylmalate dehydratase small subunit [Deltaproteobacteria bacterium]MBT7202639.1 3-isopropylmalate dehydratase small subunit [Deltaproteobacteria bacterium]